MCFLSSSLVFSAHSFLQNFICFTNLRVSLFSNSSCTSASCLVLSESQSFFTFCSSSEAFLLSCSCCLDFSWSFFTSSSREAIFLVWESIFCLSLLCSSCSFFSYSYTSCSFCFRAEVSFEAREIWSFNLFSSLLSSLFLCSFFSFFYNSGFTPVLMSSFFWSFSAFIIFSSFSISLSAYSVSLFYTFLDLF